MLTLIQCLFQPKLPQWYVKDSGHSAKSALGSKRKHAYTLDPMKSQWADYATVQTLCGNLSGNDLIRNLSGNIWTQPSKLPEPLWTDPGLKSGISVHELISTSKKKKKCTWGINGQTFA